MKPIHAQWLINLYDKCKILAIDKKEIPDEDPFNHLSEEKYIL